MAVFLQISMVGLAFLTSLVVPNDPKEPETQKLYTAIYASIVISAVACGFAVLYSVQLLVLTAHSLGGGSELGGIPTSRLAKFAISRCVTGGFFGIWAWWIIYGLIAEEAREYLLQLVFFAVVLYGIPELLPTARPEKQDDDVEVSSPFLGGQIV